MKVNQAHLTYCTNIHPGETWPEVFDSLKKYALDIKSQVSPEKPFGIGLRLSHKSAEVLLENNHLEVFKNWLINNDLYVFTMNGFPFGDFHDVVIKDQVHTPDWTTNDRYVYTKNLIKILTFLLPEGMDGGISTSPLSYKYWFKNKEEVNKITVETCDTISKIALLLIEVKESTGKDIHIDIEPEPDGFLENTAEVISFYNEYLLKNGVSKIVKQKNCTVAKAKEYILNHIQLCYDVCHFALAYEEPKEVIKTLQLHGIKVGKIQISSAIKCDKSDEVSIEEQQKCLKQFDEPTYLHQSIIRLQDNSLVHFSDLSEGIDYMKHPNFKEIRTHFHVPVFTTDFEVLQSTQADIIAALNLWKEIKYTQHLEIETYTWGVLPKYLQTDITSSIVRELKWVQHQLDN